MVRWYCTWKDWVVPLSPVKMPVAWDSTNTPNAKEGIPQDWWKAFGSPVLDGLIERALKDNPNIIATEERLKQAERTLSGSRDGLFPELSVNASTSKGRSGSSGNDIAALNTTRTTESTSLSAGLRYDVDLWGGTAARYRASVAGYIAPAVARPPPVPVVLATSAVWPAGLTLEIEAEAEIVPA